MKDSPMLLSCFARSSIVYGLHIILSLSSTLQCSSSNPSVKIYKSESFNKYLLFYMLEAKSNGIAHQGLMPDEWMSNQQSEFILVIPKNFGTITDEQEEKKTNILRVTCMSDEYCKDYECKIEEQIFGNFVDDPNKGIVFKKYRTNDGELSNLKRVNKGKNITFSKQSNEPGKLNVILKFTMP